jgi:hypothetical protein
MSEALFGDLEQPQNKLVVAILILTLLLFLGMGGFCVGSRVVFRKRVTNPDQTLEVRAGRRVRITTRWEGRHIRYPHDEAMAIDHNANYLTLVSARAVEIPWYAGGGRGAFYHICTFEAQALGETEVTVAVKESAQAHGFNPHRNTPQRFHVEIESHWP